MTRHASPASQLPSPPLHPPLPPPRSTGAQQSETELKARKSIPLSTIASVKQCVGHAEGEQAEQSVQREQSGQRELSAWEQKTWCKQSPTPHCMELLLCRYGAAPSLPPRRLGTTTRTAPVLHPHSHRTTTRTTNRAASPCP